MKSRPATLLTGGALLLLMVSQARAQNLVQDGRFLVAPGGKLPPSWKMTGGTAEEDLTLPHQREGNVTLRVQNMPGRTAKLTQTVAVKPSSELYFSADVKSAGRVVATIGGLRMAYHRQGEWQKIAGLVRTGTATSLTITLDLADLPGSSGPTQLDHVSLVPYSRPEGLPRARQAAKTVLASSQGPVATIVYPHAPALYRELAEEIQAAIRGKTGVTLPLLSDREATLEEEPNLRPELRQQNLVLLGRLGINRAMWPAYNRFLMASDGYYPGGDGFEVRTASNVLRNGYNHLVVGSSTDQGARRAVAAFLGQLNSVPAADGTLEVPWLLDVELGGECRQAMLLEEARYAADPPDPTLPKIEPGYGTVRRWYENAMAYYWTGGQGFRERSQQYLTQVLKDSTYSHHYVGEYLVRTYDMLDDSPLLAPHQAAVDRLIYQNFLDAQTTNGDLTWMTTFSPPYDGVAVTNRHQIAPWLADLAFADFLHDYLELSGATRELVHFRRSEKEQFLRHLTHTRWGASLPDLSLTEGEEETAHALLRFALERGDYRLFVSGMARRIPQIDRLDAQTGRWVRPAGPVDSHIMLGMLASYYQDGAYLTLRRQLPSDKPFMRRYLASIHAYNPGAELQPASTDKFTGVRVPPMMPHRQSGLYRLEGNQYLPPAMLPNEVFEFGAFRGGFAPEDDYVSLTGVMGGMIPGIFTSFSSRGTNWLQGGGTAGNTLADRYIDQNALSILQLDRWQSQEKPYAGAARLEWQANLFRSGALAFSMDPFVGTRWDRAVVWVRPGLFVVQDRVTARQNGRFQISVNWFPIGAHSTRNGVRTHVTRNGRLRLTSLGQDFSVPEPDAPVLRHTSARHLKVGQQATAYTVLQALKPAQEAEVSARQMGENGVLLTTPQPEDTTLVLWGDSRTAQVKSNARCLVLGRQAVQFMQGTSLDLNGRPFLRCERPVSVALNLAEKSLLVFNPGGAKSLSLLGRQVPLEVTLPEGRPQQLAVPLMEPLGPVLEAALREISLPVAATATREPVAQIPTGEGALPVTDETQKWKTVWSYSGLQRPQPHQQMTLVQPDIVDLGREVSLAELRFGPRTGSAWIPRSMPTEIWVSSGGPGGKLPEPDSPLWRKVEQKPVWRPGVRTGNYGEALPEAQDSQFLELAGQKARYIRTEGVSALQVLDQDVPGSERLLTVREVPGPFGPTYFLAPEFWPNYVGRPTPVDQVAMLGADGRVLYRHTSPTNLQVAEPLPLESDHTPSVTLATVDGKLRVLDQGGATRHEWDLFQLHQKFNQEFGRPNTRQPVGGFTLPFSLGTWRQGTGNRELIVGRYGNFSFLDAKTGALTGVLRAIGYSQPAMLPRGQDWNGDGLEEQVVMGRGALRHLTGPENRRIEDPEGHVFFPQIYQEKRILEPAWENHINGSRPLLLTALGVGKDGRGRYVAAARDNYFGFYDAREQKWSASWTPLVSLRAATVSQASSQEIRVVLATESNLIWDATFTEPVGQPAKYTVWNIADTVHKVKTDASISRFTLVCAEGGLYLLGERGQLQKVATGSFVDAIWAGGKDGTIVAVTRDGRLLQLKKSS